MPDNDNGSSRSEPGNQTNECPTNKPPVPEKTESTPQEEAKTQDAPSPESEEDPFEAEQIAEFEAWVESLKVDPDSAWRQLRIKFDALMASEMADAVDQDNQGTDETPTTSKATKHEPPEPQEDPPDHEDNCCDCDSPGVPVDYSKGVFDE